MVQSAGEARNTAEALLSLRTQVSDGMAELLSAIDESRLATNEALQHADLATKAAARADERSAEAILSAANADSAASHATEQALRAKEAAVLADTAADNANDTANHPTVVGTDNYVHIWNRATQSYDRTDIYVRGEGFKISRVFASEEEMDTYAGTDMKEGDFVLVNTGSVEDEDTARLYVRAPEGSPGNWQFLVDMSGAIGFTGKTPQISIGTVTTIDSDAAASASLTANGTDTDGNPKYRLDLAIPKGTPLVYADLTAGQIAELQRPASDAIGLINRTNVSVTAEEEKRVSAEKLRETGETERDTSEYGRKSAELLRVQAEKERENTVVRVVSLAKTAIGSADTAAADCRQALEDLEAGGGGGTVDTDGVVAALTVVVDTYKADLDSKVGDTAVILDSINEDTEVTAACALLDEINGEAV